MNKFVALFTLVLACAAPSGCAALSTVLPKVTSVVADASLILTGVDAVVQTFFSRHHVDADMAAEYKRLYSATVEALHVFKLTAVAVGKLNDGEVQSAFAKFEAAYEALREWVQTFRVQTVGKLGAEAGVPSGELRIEAYMPPFDEVACAARK